MYHLCKDADGNDYGWGHVLDYIGVEWEDNPFEKEVGVRKHSRKES